MYQEKKDMPLESDEFYLDNVNHPSHYNKGGIEVLDILKAYGSELYAGFCWGNVVKYILRYKNKNGIEDLKKGQFYLKEYIEWKEKNDE